MNNKPLSSNRPYLDDKPLERATLPVDWFSKLIIYDLGLHIGQDTEYYLKKGFNVVSIEANPYLCDSAKQKFQYYIETGKLTLLNVGISNTKGHMDFFINTERTEWSSFNKNISGRNSDDLLLIEVEVNTLAAVIEQYGAPYYIKIDIEGHDQYALSSVLNCNYQVPYISVENGSTMLNDFYRNGYSAFKYIQQNNVAELKHKFPPMEGRNADHAFQFGASGKFGEELDGPWLSYEDVYKVISQTWNIETGQKNPNWDDSVDGWFDLHARHNEFNHLLLNLIN